MGGKGDVRDLLPGKIQIFFSFYPRFDWNLAAGLGGIAEPLVAPFTDKVKHVSISVWK